MLDLFTPLVSAQKMQGKFGGAGLLVQNAAGHTVLSSNCTNSYVQQYIRDGSLPEEGTICPFNFNPFTVTVQERSELSALTDMW
jgi:hypothetical protein